MPEKFDWSLVTEAAKEWLAGHPDESPKWLLLPIDTSTKEVAELAEEIYDIPVQRTTWTEEPRFSDTLPAAPKPSASRLSERDPNEQSLPGRSILDTPIFNPPGQPPDRSKLLARAKAGLLTTAEIQAMSMEDYAAVRSYLLKQVDQATQGKTWGEVRKGWKGTKFTDITES